MVVTRYIIGLGLAAFMLFSCNNEKSLQKYLVEKQEDDTFLKIDIATSLLQAEGNNLSQEEKDILETVKKINVVAFPIKEDNLSEYKVKKEEAEAILDQKKYITLITYGSKTKGASLKYLGEEDAIDELIVFGSDEERGFMVLRLLGDNMRPDQMIKLMNSIDNGDVDINKLSTIGELFKM